MAIPLSLSSLQRKITILEETVRSLMQAQKTNSNINLRSAALKAQVCTLYLLAMYQATIKQQHAQF